MDYDDDERENIAQTLARVLPDPQVLSEMDPDDLGIPGLYVSHVATPKTFDFKEVTLDLEKYLPNPRRTAATARFADAASFLAYVARHKQDRSVAWCDFNPQTFALSFTAVIDEHDRDKAGWRQHRAVWTPDMSAEWKAWIGCNGKGMPQVTFAEWIQEHDEDINSPAAGFPTSLQMLTMATNFVANQDRRLKSAVRLQSGGVRMEYIADADAGTVEAMQLFEKFALGIPVFHGCAAWSLTARLKYSVRDGAVTFRYELVRPDKVHQHAAQELIEQIGDGLGGVPLLMGTCN